MLSKIGNLIIIFLFIIVSGVQCETTWIVPGDCKNISVNGLIWFEQNGKEFIRLPLSQKDIIPEGVWTRSLCPASVRIRFQTDSTSLKLKMNHGLEKETARANLSSMASHGVDLYIGCPGQKSFWKSSYPKPKSQEYEITYFEGFPSQMRELTFYLPIYGEMAELKIGIDTGAKILKPTDYQIKKPIVFYGTSITQGACASRGSNNFVSLAERRLNADVINFGFSGMGRCEPIMAEIMSQIDASIYVVDCVANMTAELMTQRYENFVRTLRKEKPEIPVLLMTKIHFAKEILPEEADIYQKQNQPVFDTYNKLKQQGDKNIYLFDSGEIIKPGGDHPTVDGVHPTDRGFYMLADALVPKLTEILTNNNYY